MRESVLHLRNKFIYMGLSPEEYRKAEGLVAEDNRMAVATWSLCVGFFWIYSLAISLRSPAYAACRAVYAAALGVCVITWFGMRFLAGPAEHLVRPLTLLFELSILGAGIGIALCQPDVRTVTMIAVSIIMPICVTNRTVQTIWLQLATILCYAVAAKGIIEPEIYSWGLTNLILFSLAGTIVGHVTNKGRFRRYLLEEAAKELVDVQKRYAYYDQMTGLKNRRAYVERLQELTARQEKEFCVIMADVNGLKRTNDSLGHAAGDELITGAAECLRAAFDGIDTIYRIGGDEFCVILAGPPERAQDCVARMEATTAAWKGRINSELTLSYGVASSREHSEADAILSEADHRMYEYKRDFYQRRGIDRRRR